MSTHKRKAEETPCVSNKRANTTDPIVQLAAATTCKTRRRRQRRWHAAFKRKAEETPCVSNKRAKTTDHTNPRLCISDTKYDHTIQDSFIPGDLQAVLHRILDAVPAWPENDSNKTRGKRKRKRGKGNGLKYTHETCALLSQQWTRLPWTAPARYLAKWVQRASPCHSISPSSDGAYFNSISLDIALVIADSLNLSDLFSLLCTCRSLHAYYLQGYFSSIIKKKKNSLLLLSAVESLDGDLVKVLLGDGADPNVQSEDGTHVLQMAALTAYYTGDSLPSGIVPQLLGSRQCNPNLRDRCGRTALHYAVMTRNIEICVCLILRDADPDVRTAGPGWTPLHYAVFKGYRDIVELLCMHGASVDRTDTATRGTALHFAYRYRHRDIEMQRILRRYGANKKAVDFLGLTPPNYARARHRDVLDDISGLDIDMFSIGRVDAWFRNSNRRDPDDPIPFPEIIEVSHGVNILG